MVLRRLSGKTDNTAPVLTLITQFGGGKTHTLTALYHLAKNGDAAADYPGVPELVREAGISHRARRHGWQCSWATPGIPSEGRENALDRRRSPARGRQGR